MSDESRYSVLLKKYLENTILREELHELFNATQDKNSLKILGDRIGHDLNANLPDDNTDLQPATADEIYRNIVAGDKNTNRYFSSIIRGRLIQIFSVAAMVFAMVFGAVFFYGNSTKEITTPSTVNPIAMSSITRVNQSLLPVELFLDDGSLVKLSPNSSLSYPEHFLGNKRAVYLTGEALFLVTKNPERPFLVYYNNIVTKVLGTSFKIRTNPASKNAEVSVLTGRVQVFENENSAADNFSKQQVKSVILTTNQKATYNVVLHDFKTTLADTIQLLVNYVVPVDSLKNKLPAESFLFEKATSVQQIFSRLHQLYGIEILVDNERLNHCVFTGDVSKQEMLEKLKIICLTIGATYEIRGTKIWVSGKGCN